MLLFYTNIAQISEREEKIASLDPGFFKKA
jgi:hypothetical protein